MNRRARYCYTDPIGYSSDLPSAACGLYIFALVLLPPGGPVANDTFHSHLQTPAMPCSIHCRPLPLEVIAMITEYLPLQQGRIAVAACGQDPNTEAADELCRRRSSITRYMRRLTSKASELLYHMTLCQTALCYVRAADFFYPGLANPSSPWCFLAPPSPYGFYQFSYFLVAIGVKWHYRLKALTHNGTIRRSKFALYGLLRNSRTGGERRVALF